MNFANDPVSLYLGSLGYYLGKYYASLRFYHSPEETGETLSWMANLRRYFSEDNYLFVGYGQGSKSYDIVTLEDFEVDQSRVFLAGFNWYIFQRIRLQLYFTLRDEGDIERNTLFLSTGYRW